MVVVLKTAVESIYKPNYNIIRFFGKVSTFFVMTEDMLTRNCVLVLQSCRNSLEVASGLCSERRATLSGDMSEGVSTNAEITGMNIKVEKIPVVKFEEETAMDIKQEDFPWDIKAEEDQVSHVCLSVMRYILRISRNAYHLL